MHKFNSYLMLSLVAFLFSCLLLQATLTTGSMTTVPEDRNEMGIDRIGVIYDQMSRAGKEAKVAIEIAIQDFNNETNQHSVLYYKTSQSKAGHAAIAAKELIDEHKVKAIVGGHTWEEASAIAEAISEANHDHDIPMFLSLANKNSLQEPDQWPFFIEAVPTQSTQITALAAILQSLGIHQVTLLYETSSSASIVSHLSQAFRKTGPELTNILSLTSNPSSLDEELELLKKQQRKVFVVHTSLELGVRLFQQAKKMEMTGDGYLWITTNQITDLFHSINSTVISSLKGMVGVKTYIPQNNPEFLHFKKRFRQKFQSSYPEEHQDEPGIFALQAYNAAKQLEKYSLESIHQWKPVPATTVEIVYVHGKGYHSVYWTEGSGFSEGIEDDISGVKNHTDYTDNVGQALWPAKPWYADRRRRNLAESSTNRMRVAIPAQSLFKQFVNVENAETNEPKFTGFVVDVFDEMMTQLNIQYDSIAFNKPSYDLLIEELNSTVYDAVAGDVTILSARHELVDFTQPFTESGLEMIVRVRSRLSNQAWLFLKPFTGKMWWLIAALTLYNGFIIWLIERNHNEDLRGSIVTKIGIIIWLAFTTLFTLRGDKLHSNLSRMAMVVWLFVALIITQSYTASLASMLTAERLEPSITSVEMLKNMNENVGSCSGSTYVKTYLNDVLGFDPIKTKYSYNSTDAYAEALNSGEVAAIFLDVPVAKLFLAQYCKSFIRSGETFKVGGFGFAFHKGYPGLSNANQALMDISESRKLKELEDKHLSKQKCVDEESSPDIDGRLSIHSFWVLFVLTGGSSTVALAFYVIISIREFRKSNQDHIHLLKIISSFMKDWKPHMRRSSSIVVNVESV